MSLFRKSFSCVSRSSSMSMGISIGCKTSRNTRFDEAACFAEPCEEAPAGLFCWDLADSMLGGEAGAEAVVGVVGPGVGVVELAAAGIFFVACFGIFFVAFFSIVFGAVLSLGGPRILMPSSFIFVLRIFFIKGTS